MIKTFKIGESAIGGIIRVSTRPKNVYEVKCLDFFNKDVVKWRYCFGLDELRDYCEEISTGYWADRIVSHFKKKLEL